MDHGNGEDLRDLAREIRNASIKIEAWSNQQLDQVKMLATLDARTQALDGKVQNLTGEVTSLGKLLRGNGQPGLVQKLASAEHEILVLNKRLEEQEEHQKVSKGNKIALVVAVIGGLFGILSSIFGVVFNK